MAGMRNYLLRLIYYLVNPLRRVYWFIFRPRTRGVKCIIECDNKILFVKLSYAHRSWTVPGGGVSRSESCQAAAYRELFEETGIKPDSLVKIGEYKNHKEFKHDDVEVYYGKVNDLRVRVDGFEIIAACWADPLNLPKPHARRLPDLMLTLQRFKYEK